MEIPEPDEFAFLDDPSPDSQPSSVSTESEDESLASEINLNPLTGAIVDMKDVDSVIRACIDAKQQVNDLKCFEEMLRRHLGAMTSGDKKTRRVKGKTLTAKVEMPDNSWDQTILKEAYNSYPNFREQYLKISQVGVQKVEFNKLAEMTVADENVAFSTFKGMLQAAVKPPTGAPTISLEG